MPRRALLFMMLAVCGIGLAAPARGEGPASVTVSGVAADGGVLTLGVSVADDAGLPVEGLTAADFRVEVAGRDVPVELASSGEDSSLPLDLILVVDTSGSMAGQPLTSAKQALSGFAASVQPADRLALVSFDDAVEDLVPLTSDRALLAGAINGLAAAGNTALYDAVTRAVALASSAESARRAVVFLADGEDFGGVSAAGREAALIAAAASGVPFYVVGLGDALDAAFLESLALSGGGRYLAASSPGDLVALYGEISAWLRLQYTLRARLPDGIGPGEVPVSVRVGEARGSGQLVVAAPAAASTPAATPSLRGLPADLTAPAVVSIDAAPAGAIVRWSLDSVEAPAGPELTLDPHTLPPGVHNLVATLSVDGASTAFEASFSVPVLPPRLVSPLDLPPLRAGDVLLLTVASHQAPVTVRYAVDGEVVQTDEAPPYRFVVPPPAGDQPARLTIELSDANGTAPYAFEVEPPPPPGSSWVPRIAAFLGLILLAAGTVAIAWFMAHHWRRRREERVDPPPFEGPGPAFERWAIARAPGSGEPSTPPLPGDATAPAGPWGRLAIIAGPDQGAEFELKDDAELAGRGHFCSIRLRDRAVEPAHVLFNRDGTYRASSPGLSLEVDGTPASWGLLRDGAEIRLGATVLQFRRAAH